MKDRLVEKAWQALDKLKIELPSWGFANTGTRFGKFIQAAAATTIEEKFSDAAQVHSSTGACPTLALHVQWDLPNGLKDVGEVERLSQKFGVRPGSINPNMFQNQEYKYGSLGNPDPAIRKTALRHILDCVGIAEALHCRDVAPWFADGSNYPGTQNMRQRIAYFEEGLREIHRSLKSGQRLLIEYKPFEPAFYHTDIADWGMAYLLAKEAGPQAFVLVDTGHHYQAQNIEQIVAWLLHHKMIGGFHFNDRRYADDDLTLGSIDPYQVFRIFHEIHMFEWEKGTAADIAYMVDQSHNLKGKIEAMIQTVCTAQELYARAAMVDHERLAGLQQSCSLVDAEETLRGAFWTDTRSIVAEWRKSKGLPSDPLLAFRESGYLERVSRERSARNSGASASYA
ncbi:MAG TPA: TIM barrel protein [Candidatus Angelobacter sp.]|nr:TIM barrel protein [Candidatus Angelobacter sp.]